MQFRVDGGNGPGLPLRRPGAAPQFPHQMAEEVIRNKDASLRCSQDSRLLQSASSRGVLPLEYGPRLDNQKYNTLALSRAHLQPSSPKSSHGGDDLDETPPSRHLWVGNVSQEVTERLLVERFSKFGPIESVTVYSQRNYAFINFKNLDSAQDAKNGLQGVALGGLAMRIEFAKGAKPSRHLWVGGIGLTVSREQIEGEFKRFGTMEDFKFLRDRNCAFVDYEKMEDAIAAVDSLNRIRIGDEELRVDFGRSQPPKRENYGRPGTATSHEELGAVQTRNGRDNTDHLRAPIDPYNGPPNEFRQCDRKSPGASFCGPSDVPQAGTGSGASGPTLVKTKGEKEEPSDVLWVGFPLLSKVDEEGLRRAFVPYGEVERVKTFPGRTYAFVQFKNVEEASRAKDALEGRLFNDPRVHIRFSNSEVGPVDNSRTDGILSSPSRGREVLGHSENAIGRGVNNERLGSMMSPLRATGLRPEYYPGGLARGAMTRSVVTIPGISLGHGEGRGLRPRGPDERTPLDQIVVRGGRGLPGPATRPGARFLYEEQWELPEEEVLKREPKRLRMLHVGGPDPVHDVSYEVGRRHSESDKFGISTNSGRQEYVLLPPVPSIGVGEEHNKGIGIPRAGPGSVQFDGTLHMAAGQGHTLTSTTTGSGPINIVNVSSKRESFAAIDVVAGLNEGWRWHGTIAKGGTPVCRAQCLPVGKGIDVTVPDVVNCTARTDLDMLAKHVCQAGDFGVVFFVPEADPDVPPYHDFMHYLGEKHRAGVAKLADGTTLFLVPPSEFSERVLKVPGNNCLFGVVLKSQPHSSVGHPQHQQPASRPASSQQHHFQQKRLQRQPQQLLVHQKQYSYSQSPSVVSRNSAPDVGAIPGLFTPQGHLPALTSMNSTLNSSQLATLASGLPTVLTPELIVSLTALLPHQNQSTAFASTSLSIPSSNVVPPTSREVTGKAVSSLVSTIPSSSLIDDRIVYRSSQGNQHSAAQSQGWACLVSDNQSSSSGSMSSPSDQGSGYLPPPLPHVPQISHTAVLQLPLSGSIHGQVQQPYSGAQTPEVPGSEYGGQQLPLHTRHPQQPVHQLGNAPLLPSDRLAQLTALLTQRPQQQAQQHQAAQLLYQHYHQQQLSVHAVSQQHQQQHPQLTYHQPQVQSYHQQINPPLQQYASQSSSQQLWAQGGPLPQQAPQLTAHSPILSADNGGSWDGGSVAQPQHQQVHNQPQTPSPTLQQSHIPLSQQGLPSGNVTGETPGIVGQDDAERQNRFQATLQLAAALLQQMQHQQTPGQVTSDQR